MNSLLTTILGFALVAHSQAHVSIISIYGSNDRVGHAFGVDLNGRYPRVKGAPGDAGGDSGIFQTGTDNPSPACGGTPELGPLDVPAWLDQAEGFGLPAAYSNMSVVMEVFQVNRDGGGPMSCEYNQDATATSWSPMFMTLNQAGNAGIENQQRVNSTVVANFPKDATCTGGFTQTACIVRCRTGVNKRFGGCFAVKLSDSEPFTATLSTATDLNNTAVSRTATGAPSIYNGELSDQDVDRLAQKILLAMESNGFLISAAAVGTLHNSSLSISNSSSGAISRLLQANESVSSVSSGFPGLNLTTPVSEHNTTTATLTPDASDLAGASDVADASATNNSGPADVSGTADASDMDDAQVAAQASATTPEASRTADPLTTTDSLNTANATDASDTADADVADVPATNNSDPADASGTADASDMDDARVAAQASATTPGGSRTSGPLITTGSLNTANATDASDAADAAFYASKNQTQLLTPVAHTSSPKNAKNNGTFSDNPNQITTSSPVVVVHRSKRHSCGAQKKRHRTSLSN